MRREPMNPDVETLGLSDAERRFVRQLAAGYRPDPMPPERRTAFDRALLDRLETRQRRWVLAPGGALAAVTAAWLWFVLAGSNPDVAPRVDRSPDRVARVDRDLSWEQVVLYGSADPAVESAAEEGPEAERDGLGALPPDYSAIGSLFLGDDDLLDG